jgi:hypothetical protein
MLSGLIALILVGGFACLCWWLMKNLSADTLLTINLASLLTNCMMN